MATYLVPLEDILTDPDHPVDLTALPPEEAIERIKQIYGFWGPLIDVRIEEGVAVVELPDAQASRAGSALDKIRQAAKAGRSGRYREAAALYEEALQVLPQHTEARRELAMVQMELGQAAAAKQNLIRVLQLDPRDAWAYLVLGNLYYKHEHDGGSAERSQFAERVLAKHVSSCTPPSTPTLPAPKSPFRSRCCKRTTYVAASCAKAFAPTIEFGQTH